MRLKHLKLQGYKSFATKTEFEFPTGITAIIGPNGSGKSNIADGIRWALGERSMSTLRAKSSADMIFAGGEGRARAGMAEVSLTFDNADGSLPIEFSEVTITRRAYRSGENEYLINGAKVLLRDITELLSESGLSERTYTVVSQGLVDAALSLRPQERRELFEEAAGITLHRDRREKTIERLDETEHNLERVRDITSEITPRLKRLRRDAERVEEHRRLTAHLERLQRTWYGYRWGRQQDKLDRALERASTLEAQLERRRQQAVDLEEQLAQVRRREGELRAQLRDWYRESADLHEQADEAQRELAVSEERERLLKARREELLSEIEPLEARREEQAQQVQELGQQVEELEREQKERQRQFEAVEREVKARQQAVEEKVQQRAQVERELRTHRAKIEQLDQALIEAREEVSRLASEGAVVEERARQLESRREEVLGKLEPLSEREAAQSERIEQCRAEVERLEDELAARQERLAKLEQEQRANDEEPEPPPERMRVAEELQTHRAERKRLEQALREAQGEEARLRGELKALQRMHETGGAYDKGTQALLQADLEGVLDPLAALIQAPARWEAAIEAALGNDLQAVVVRWALEQGARLQKESWQVGRVTLLPLDALHPHPPLPEGALSGASVVECDERVRKIVDVVLGSIALCDDLSQAQALLPHMPPGSRCVTAEGVVLRADGALVVGQVGSSEVLADERARRELPKQLEGLRRRLQEMEENRQAITQHIAGLEERLKEIDRQAAARREKETRILQERLGEARTEAAVIKETLRSQRADLRREREALEQLQAQRASLRGQANRLASEHADALERAQMLRDAVSQMEAQPEDEIQSTGEASSGFRAKLAAAHQRCYEIEEQQRAASRRVASLEAELEQWTEQVTEARDKVARIEREKLANARTAVAVVEESLRSQRAALKREVGLLEQLRSQVDARHRRAEELKTERVTLVSRVEELRQAVNRLQGALREIREHIQPTEKTLDRLGEKREDLEKRVQRARGRVRDAETHHGRAQMEVERAQDELRILAERIEEDFGLVELELAESVTAQTPLPMRPLVSELPVVEELPEGLEEEMTFLKKRLRRLGSINPNAPEELDEVQERHHFLTEQADDLKAASTKLRQAVNDLDDLMEAAFQETFDAVAGRFSEMFTALFGGGTARLELIEPDDLLNTGIEIVARPPGKHAQRLALLSGGERALTAAALLFSLLHVSPTPFCVFDEVDAMLDEANVGRFRTQLERLAQQTQFIVITHNRNTVESADTVYGISMGSDAVSQVVSLKLEDVEEQ